MKKRQAPARGRSARRRGARDEIIALHRSIFRRNQQRINASVHGYTAAFRRYERAYDRSVATYERKASFEELDRQIASSDIVYVGDYHTLKQAQRGFLRLLRRLPTDRRVTIALEFVQGRHQKVLDRYMAGELGDEEFLRGIDHAKHWVFGGWEHFKLLFDLARERGWRMLAIDAASRGGAGTSLVERDHYAANRLEATRRTDPDALLMVLIGELHVNPAHLPRVVAERFARGEEPRSLSIHQNCHEIYFQLEERGLEHSVDLVRIRERQYCLLNTPPIVCQQSFLTWLDVDDETLEVESPEETFKEYARIVAQFFQLPLAEQLDEVEVASVVDLSFLNRLRKRGDFTASDMRHLKRQILRSESYFIPRARMVYLGNLSINHSAEEATHFLRDICAKPRDPKLLVDAFYARCLEEALGFLGSKLINHKRKTVNLAQLTRMARSSHADAGERSVAKLVRKHIAMERGAKVRGMSEVYQCDADTFNAVTHVLGYRLGELLYYGMVEGAVAKDQIRSLFFENWEDEGAALTTYLVLAARTRAVRTPERM